MNNVRPTEFCALCEMPTGKAGQGDDSTYIECPDGSGMVGPLCDGCGLLLLPYDQEYQRLKRKIYRLEKKIKQMCMGVNNERAGKT